MPYDDITIDMGKVINYINKCIVAIFRDSKKVIFLGVVKKKMFKLIILALLNKSLLSYILNYNDYSSETCLNYQI
jgi:hypothetical protein